MLDFRTYHITGPFLWSKERALPQYRLDILRRFYIYTEVTQYDYMRSHPWQFLARKIWIYYYTYLFGFGLLLLFGITTLFRRYREKLLLAALLGVAGFALNVVLMHGRRFRSMRRPLRRCCFSLWLWRSLTCATVNGR